MRDYINYIKLVMSQKGITRKEYFAAERLLNSKKPLPYHVRSYYINFVTHF